VWHLVTQIFKFMRVHRKFWLGPVIFFLVVIGLLLVTMQGSAVAPFIYAIF
jgi:hypothetical protein